VRQIVQQYYNLSRRRSMPATMTSQVEPSTIQLSICGREYKVHFHMTGHILPNAHVVTFKEAEIQLDRLRLGRPNDKFYLLEDEMSSRPCSMFRRHRYQIFILIPFNRRVPRHRSGQHYCLGWLKLTGTNYTQIGIVENR
jgi:hypothetical protein